MFTTLHLFLIWRILKRLSIHASGVLDFLLDPTALWVGGLRKVGIDLQLRHIGLHRVACADLASVTFHEKKPSF